MNTELSKVVRRALNEDVGTGDITTESVVQETACANARMLAKSSGVIAGLPVVEEVFRQVDPGITVQRVVGEGDRVKPGDVICFVAGPARGILSGERVALNFIQRLSGIATKTARFVELVSGTNARIVDTRKTTPGLRFLEKYAVRVGGGFNHRMGLFDAVMIKDNHILAGGGIANSVHNARARIPHTMSVTVECATLEQVDEAISAGADILLLDNMDNVQRSEAARRAAGKALTEASGGITEESVALIAQTGVDIISIGALTHSAPALDISLDILTISTSNK